MKKWMLRVLICAALVGVFCLPSLAVGDSEERAVINSGTCGTNLTYTLYSDGELVISGTGAMEYWGAYIENPWYKNRAAITTVTIEDGVTNIGKFAFCHCVALLNITIPDSVTSIGESAFYGCTQLSSASIPDSVKKIGAYAFEDCKSLASVDLGNGLNTIGSYAFSGCTALTAVTIPSSVTSSYAAFYKCTALTAATIENGVTAIDEVTFYGCSALASVTIPDGVTSIGTDAFFGCPGVWAYGSCGSSLAYVLHNNGELQVTGTGAMNNASESYFAPWHSGRSRIKTVTIGDNVTSIGKYAFYNSGALTSVTMGKNVTSIGAYAFYNSSALTSVTMGENVASIGSSAFEYCSSLATVTIPDSVISIGQLAFRSCPAVMTYGSCGSSLAYVLHSDGHLQITGTGAMTNWTSSSNVPWYANRSSIKTVTIGGGVTSIGSYTFLAYENLTSIIMGNNVERIGYGAVALCSNLASVTISEKVTSIDGEAFYKCTGLTSVTIPESVASIGGYAFMDCTNLTNVTLGENITYIGYYAFRNCPAVISSGDCGPKVSYVLHSDGQLQIAGAGAMTNWSSSSSVSWYSDCVSIKTIIIGDSVTSIGDYAFYDSDEVTRVDIPENITKIGAYAFGDCNNLTAVVLSDSVTAVGENAFDGCTELAYAFYVGAAQQWDTITIGSGNDKFTTAKRHYITDLNDIVTVAVGECENGTISAPGMTAKGEQVTVTATPAVGYKLSKLFANGVAQEGLTFTVPDTQNVTLTAEFVSMRPGETVVTGGTCGDNVSWALYESGELVIYGEGAMQNYSFNNNAPWYSYTEQITTATIEPGIAKISECAFYGCSSLTSANIPDGITAISNNAFYGCSKLTCVTIPDSTTVIGESAFNNCIALTSVVIGEKVAIIGDKAFYNCGSLTAIDLPADITEIGEGVFCGCSKLEAVRVPESNPYYFGRGILYSYDGTFLWCAPHLTGTYEIPREIVAIGDGAFSGSSLDAVIIPARVETIGSNAFDGCDELSHAFYLGDAYWWQEVVLGSGNEQLTEVLHCGKVTDIDVQGLAWAYPVGTTTEKLGTVTLTLSSGEVVDITDVATFSYDFSVAREGVGIYIDWWNYGYAVGVTVYSGAHADFYITDARDAKLKLYAQQAGQAIVAFYDSTTGQMLDAQVFTMPTGNSEVILTAEEVDLMAADCKIILLDVDGKPLCNAIQPEDIEDDL